MQKLFLESQRLFLREFTNDDLKNLFSLNSNPEVMKHIGRKPVTDIEECKKTIEQIRDYYKKHNGFGVWVAYKKSNNKFVGFFVLQYLDNTKEIEVGFRVMKKYWGKGYSTEMTNELIQYGFIQKNLNKIVGITHSDNIASQKVLQKAGLTYIKKAHFYKTDVMYFAIYAEDFQSKIT